MGGCADGAGLAPAPSSASRCTPRTAAPKQLETRRAYLDGDWVLGSEDEPLERDGGQSAAATTKNDTLVCSLMAEMTPKMLDFVASEWTQRARDFH